MARGQVGGGEAMNRASDGGWIRITPFDVGGRRAIWMRHVHSAPSLEICSGREGDDDYVMLTDPIMVQNVANLLDQAAFFYSRDDEEQVDQRALTQTECYLQNDFLFGFRAAAVRWGWAYIERLFPAGETADAVKAGFRAGEAAIKAAEEQARIFVLKCRDQEDGAQ